MMYGGSRMSLSELYKNCYICNEKKHVDEFRESKIGHVMRIKSQLGRCFRCLKCEEKL